MSAPLWPQGLPCPNFGTVIDAPASVLRSFRPDLGPPLTRRASTARWGRLSFTLRLTREELQLLETFLHRDLAGGALPFRMTHPVSRVLTTFRLAAGESDAYTVTQVAPNAFDVPLAFVSVPE